MASFTAASAAMDWMQVIPLLLDGIAQEMGLETKEFKIVLVANEVQIDPKRFQDLHQHYHDLTLLGDPAYEWQSAHASTHQIPAVHHQRRQRSNHFTDGSSPVSLYQVGSHGSRLSALRSKMSCAMEGNFSSKGAPRMGEIKHFQARTHVKQQVSEKFLGSPLPVETFLHIHTCIRSTPSLASSAH